MRLLLAEKDYETIVFYWRLLELVSEFEDLQDRGKCTLSYAIIKRELGWNFQRTYRVLTKIAQTFKIELKQNLDQTWEVFVPNWLELQQNKGTYDRHKKTISTGEERREKRDIRIKNKDKRVKNKNIPPPVDWFELKPVVWERIKHLKYSEDFFNRQWGRLLAYDAGRPYKNRMSGAVNWFTGKICTEAWEREMPEPKGFTKEDLINNPDLAEDLGIDPHAYASKKEGTRDSN